MGGDYCQKWSVCNWMGGVVSGGGVMSSGGGMLSIGGACLPVEEG